MHLRHLSVFCGFQGYGDFVPFVCANYLNMLESVVFVYRCIVILGAWSRLFPDKRNPVEFADFSEILPDS